MEPSLKGFPSPPERARILLFVFVLVVAVRMGVEATAIFSQRVWVRRTDPASSFYLNMWRQWDATHYLELAQRGYRTRGEEAFNIVFPPLYPWTIRILNILVGDYLVSALLLSFLSSLVASYFLYLLARQEMTEDAARGSVFFLNAFPTAYFLIAPYTESFFLAITLASIYMVYAGRFGAACLLGSLAGATRVNGLILLPTLLLLHWRQAASSFFSRKLLWSSILPAGFLLYLAINLSLFGDPFHFMTVQREHWHHSFRWPWEGLRDVLLSPFEASPSHERAVIFDLGALFLLLALLSCLWSALYLPVAYTFQGAATLCLLLCTSWNISLGRYVLGVIPLFFFLGALSRRPLLRLALVIFFLPLLGFLSTVFTAGRWAY